MTMEGFKMSEEFKVVSWTISEGKINFCIDPNQNGKCLFNFIIDITEFPSEVSALFAKLTKKDA